MEKLKRELTRQQQDAILEKASDINWINVLLDNWLLNPHNRESVEQNNESLAHQFQRLATKAGLIIPESEEAPQSRKKSMLGKKPA